MVYFEAFYLDFLSSKNPEIRKSEHQGVRKQIFYGGHEEIKKIISCQISKFYSINSKNMGGGHRPQGPPPQFRIPWWALYSCGTW